MIPSYPKVHRLGHANVHGILSGKVIVQEKIDGSQFSFMRKNGELLFRSRGKKLDKDNPDVLFADAIKGIQEIETKLVPGWVYRGECLRKPKHNVIKYDRAPKKNVILWEIETGPGEYAGQGSLSVEAASLGLDSVPVYFIGMATQEHLESYLGSTPVLGGKMIEGVVVKSISMRDKDGKILVGKIIAKDFDEVRGNPSKINPQKELLQSIMDTYPKEPRWEKAYQHIRDNGDLTGTNKDIGLLCREVHADMMEECKEQIKEILFKQYWKKIAKSMVHGLPEWYSHKDRV